MATPYSIPHEPQHTDATYAPVPVRAPNPETLARIDAWLADLTPEEEAMLKEAERLDRGDNKHNR